MASRGFERTSVPAHVPPLSPPPTPRRGRGASEAQPAAASGKVGPSLAGASRAQMGAEPRVWVLWVCRKAGRSVVSERRAARGAAGGLAGLQWPWEATRTPMSPRKSLPQSARLLPAAPLGPLRPKCPCPRLPPCLPPSGPPALPSEGSTALEERMNEWKEGGEAGRLHCTVQP